MSCKKGGFVNDETTPEVGQRRTKQDGSAAPEQSAAAPRTGAPNARNVAPGRTYRCGAGHTFNALAHSGFDGAPSARSRSSSARAGVRTCLRHKSGTAVEKMNPRTEREGEAS